MTATTAPINDAISEGNASIRNLTVELARVNEYARKMDDTIQIVERKEVKRKLLGQSAAIAETTNSCVVTSKFYDKLQQRLAQVSNSLAEIKPKRDVQSEWHQLQKLIRSQYTVELDVVKFDAIMRGDNTDPPTPSQNDQTDPNRIQQNIELF